MSEELNLEKSEKFVCPTCGQEFESRKGLAGHERLAHQKPTKQNGYKDYVDGVLEKQNDILSDKIKALEEALESMKTKLDDTKESIKSHKTVEQIAECPTCSKAMKVDDFCSKFLRKTWKDRMNLDTECYACGFPVAMDEPACPICGGTKPKGREDGRGYDESTWVIKPEE
jgi:rubrerythrin